MNELIEKIKRDLAFYEERHSGMFSIVDTIQEQVNSIAPISDNEPGVAEALAFFSKERDVAFAKLETLRELNDFCHSMPIPAQRKQYDEEED
jgi:hypothetical protein